MPVECLIVHLTKEAENACIYGSLENLWFCFVGGVTIFLHQQWHI